VTVEQIQHQIQRLPTTELVRFAEWFNGFLVSQSHSGASADATWQETPELVEELNRRLAEFTANPAMAVPFEPDYFGNLKRQLEDERAPKASSR